MNKLKKTIKYFHQIYEWENNVYHHSICLEELHKFWIVEFGT